MNSLKIHDNDIQLKKLYATEAEAYSALLTEDLASVSIGNKELEEKSDGQINSASICEVISLRDISKRLTDPPSSSHAFLLLLTDGTTEVQAFEYTSWDFSLTPGSKILLIPPIQIRRKILLVNPNNIVVLAANII